MKEIVIRKGIIVVIILVFIIASFVSNINGNIREVDDLNSNFKWHKTFLGGDIHKRNGIKLLKAQLWIGVGQFSRLLMVDIP